MGQIRICITYFDILLTEIQILVDVDRITPNITETKLQKLKHSESFFPSLKDFLFLTGFRIILAVAGELNGAKSQDWTKPL